MTPENSEIVKFFQDQTILLTGVTGFLGKILLEKLLRVCWDVRKVYVLVRPKKNKTPQQRFDEVLNLPCFDLIRHKNVEEKVSVIAGDCEKPSLGLSSENTQILAKETTLVLHVAANVKLDQTLRDAGRSVTATQEIIASAKTMPHLKALLFVSTAYSNSIHPHIKEDFYAPPIKAETLFNLVESTEDEVLEKITPFLLKEWPNAYAFAKSISEDLIRRSGAEIPSAIVRPSLVANAIEEPRRGWVDNVYGFTGITLGVHMGVVRSLYGINDNRINMVPADHVVDCFLAATWRTARERRKVAQVYNCVGQKLAIGYASQLLHKFYWEFPSEKYLWYKAFTITSKNRHLAWNLFYNTLFHLLHFFFWCIGQSTSAIKKCTTLNKMIWLLSYFATHEWEFDENNVLKLRDEMSAEDKKIFKFGEDIDWFEYIRTCCLGNRLYLLKDPLDTIPRGRKKARMLFVVHYTLIALLCYVTYVLVSFVYNLYKK